MDNIENHGNTVMTAALHSSTPSGARPVTGYIADDLLHFHRPDGQLEYQRVMDFAKLKKADIAKLARVSPTSVRWDDKMPESVAERLQQIANIANLVAEFFHGDAKKVALWFSLPNPSLGDISPRDLIRAGRYKLLQNFVLDAREAEYAGRGKAAST
jgi:hypothetical protein